MLSKHIAVCPAKSKDIKDFFLMGLYVLEDIISMLIVSKYNMTIPKEKKQFTKFSLI